MRERTRSHLFVLVLAFLMLWWQPGIFLDDETGHAASMTSLAQGHLALHGDLPPGYEDLRAGKGDWSGIPEPGHRTNFVEPPGPMIIALPVLWLMQGVDVVAPAMTGLGVVAGLVVAGALSLEVRRHTAWKPAWLGVPLLVFIGIALAASCVPAPFASSPLYEIASLQVVSMACVAGAGVLVHDVARRAWGQRAGTMALVLLVLGSPAFFWAQAIKYHAPTVLLVAWAVYGLCSPNTWRHVGWATGLAYIVHVPTAIAMTAAGAAAALLDAARTRSWHPAQYLAHGAAALTPFALYQQLKPPAGPVTQPVASESGTLTMSMGGAWIMDIWADVHHVLERAWQMFTAMRPMDWLVELIHVFLWTPMQLDTDPLPVLVMAPFLVFIAMHKWRLSLSVVYGLVLVLGIIAGAGDRLSHIGAGLDYRYLASTWPILVLASIPGLMRWRGRLSPRRLHKTWPAWITAGTLALLVSSMILQLTVAHPGYGAALLPMRFLGFAFLCFALVAVVWYIATREHAGFEAHLCIVFSASLWITVALTGLLHGNDPPFVLWPIQVLSDAAKAVSLA